MKKLLLLAGLCLFGLRGISQNFSVGPVIGAQHTFITPYSNWNFNPEWTAGLSLTYSSMQHWGYGLDVRYSREGSRITNSEGSEVHTLYEYIRVPLKAMYFFNEYGKSIRPKVTLGPSIGILVNGNDVDPRVNKLDAGANVSAGANFRLGTDIWLTTDVNYYQGFTKINPSISTTEWNSNLGINVGVTFGF